jgi:hypothetical protein
VLHSGWVDADYPGGGEQERWANSIKNIPPRYKEWFGLSRAKAEDLLTHADAAMNIGGATRLAEEELTVGRLVYFGTSRLPRDRARERE